MSRVDRLEEIRRQIALAAADPRKAGPVARAFGHAVNALILVNALLVLVTPGLDPAGPLAGAVRIADLASAVVFCAEYVLRLWCADLARPDCTPARARLRYALSPLGLIDLLAFAPSMLLLLAPEPMGALANTVAVVRLVRLIKVSRHMEGLAAIGRVISKHRDELVSSVMVLGLLTVSASVLMYQIEHPAQPERFDSMLTGVYWAITTITSTGYGDLVPITPAGRTVGFFTMLLSVGVVAIPAGIFSAGFVDEFRSERERASGRDDGDPADHNGAPSDHDIVQDGRDGADPHECPDAHGRGEHF